jgi:glutathione peroxidase
MRDYSIPTLILTAMALGAAGGSAPAAADTPCPDTLDFTVKALAQDQAVNLCATYRGRVVLIVNTASKCGYTPQYEGLEALYETYRDAGLVVLGFPSNDFAGQEPGTEQQIQEFCRLTYDVKFPMFAKTAVTAANAHPLYQRLAAAAGGYPQWNFHKYLLDRNGKLVGSFPSKVEPQSPELIAAIERLL